jgi:hypothetical protein
MRWRVDEVDICEDLLARKVQVRARGRFVSRCTNTRKEVIAQCFYGKTAFDAAKIDFENLSALLA